MSKKRLPHYDDAFKRQAAEQVLLHHRPVAQVAREFRCSPQSVTHWINRLRSTITSSIVSSPLPPSSKTSISRTTFLPLQVEDDLSIPSDSKIEVVTKSGLTLRFPIDTPSDTLIGIVRQLEASSC